MASANNVFSSSSEFVLSLLKQVAGCVSPSFEVMWSKASYDRHNIVSRIK